MSHATSGNTPFEADTGPRTADNWPESLWNEPRTPDPFPWRIFLRWLLPGVAGAVMLAAIALYFNARAQRQIVYLTQSGNLSVIRANGRGARQLNYQDLQGTYHGSPQWSPRGDRFSIATARSSDLAVLIASPERSQPDRIPVGDGSDLVLPGQAWSPTGSYLAAVKYEFGDGPSLALLDVDHLATVPVTLTIDPQTRPMWHPTTDRLLVTSQTDGVTPTLQIVDRDGRMTPFAPQDGLVARSAGAWSPDGTTIAYMGQASLTSPASPEGQASSTDQPNSTIQPSSIWLAQQDGNQPREVVKDGVNTTPIWSPRGDLLFFTRLITETGQYELHRLDLGTMQMARIENINPRITDLTTDPGSVLDWSPDRSELFFQSAPSQGSLGSVYVARYDGSDAHSVYNDADSSTTTVRWAPTGRALLISNPLRGTVLQWLHEDRQPTQFPDGLFPAWQP